MDNQNGSDYQSMEPTIDSLNEYVLIKIFNFLNVNNKLNCTKVCKRFKKILNSSICQPKRLSITVNSDVPFTELNCNHSGIELIDGNSTFNLADYSDHHLLEDGLFANLNLLILNFIFIDYSPVLDLSKLKNLKHLEVHGHLEFVDEMCCPSVEHLFLEKFKSNLFNHFPNVKCLCLNKLKLDSSDLLLNKSFDRLVNQLSNQQSESSSYELKQCHSLVSLKINYLPVQFNNQSDLIKLLFFLTPNLEQIYVCLTLYENEENDFEDDEVIELDQSAKLNSPNPNNTNNTNCIVNKMINLAKNLRKLNVIDIEFDLDQMINLKTVNNFLLYLTHELSLLKLKSKIHFKFAKSLDSNSMDVAEFRNYLKMNANSNLNEIIINGLNLKNLTSSHKFYHLINVEELYLTDKDLSLFNKPIIYNYLSNVHTLCFECNLNTLKLSELFSKLNQVKYIYLDCSVNQDHLNQIPICRPNLEYLAIEELNGCLDLEFLHKFNNLFSLYLGKIERINLDQLFNLVRKSKHLTYLCMEYRLLGKSFDYFLSLFASNARQSTNLYHISLSMLNYQLDHLDHLKNLVKIYQSPNLKISFY